MNVAELTALAVTIGGLAGGLVNVIAAWWRGQAEDRKARVDATIALNEAAVSLVEPLKRRVSELDEQVTSYMRRIQELEERVETLQGENRQLRDDVSKLRAENTEMRRGIDDLCGQIQALGHEPVYKNQVSGGHRTPLRGHGPGDGRLDG